MRIGIGVIESWSGVPAGRVRLVVFIITLINCHRYLGLFGLKYPNSWLSTGVDLVMHSLSLIS